MRFRGGPTPSFENPRRAAGHGRHDRFMTTLTILAFHGQGDWSGSGETMTDIAARFGEPGLDLEVGLPGSRR